MVKIRKMRDRLSFEIEERLSKIEKRLFEIEKQLFEIEKRLFEIKERLFKMEKTFFFITILMADIGQISAIWIVDKNRIPHF